MTGKKADRRKSFLCLKKRQKQKPKRESIVKFSHLSSGNKGGVGRADRAWEGAERGWGPTKASKAGLSPDPTSFRGPTGAGECWGGE